MFDKQRDRLSRARRRVGNDGKWSCPRGVDRGAVGDIVCQDGDSFTGFSESLRYFAGMNGDSSTSVSAEFGRQRTEHPYHTRRTQLKSSSRYWP
jgi:hypothetical protein